MGKRLLVEAEIAAVLDRVLEVPSVTPKRDGEGDTTLFFSSFWDFTVKFAPLVELLHEWYSPITDDGSTCGIVSGFLNLESIFAIADAALLFLGDIGRVHLKNMYGSCSVGKGMEMGKRTRTR